LALQADT